MKANCRGDQDLTVCVSCLPGGVQSRGHHLAQHRLHRQQRLHQPDQQETHCTAPSAGRRVQVSGLPATCKGRVQYAARHDYGDAHYPELHHDDNSHYISLLTPTVPRFIVLSVHSLSALLCFQYPAQLFYPIWVFITSGIITCSSVPFLKT